MKGSDNHLDASMDDTSSLPTTNIINLSYDRSKFFLVFFKKKKKQINKRTMFFMMIISVSHTRVIWLTSRVQLLFSSLFFGFILFQSFKSFSFAISTSFFALELLCLPSNMLIITITSPKNYNYKFQFFEKNNYEEGPILQCE
jgi:hypothetical protein